MNQTLSTDALKKMKAVLDEINICVFTTNDNEERKNNSRIMPTTKVEDDGTIWFLINKNSKKIDEIESNSAVHLMYAHPGKKNYVDVWGNALMIDDNNKIDELWSPVEDAWFPQGKNKNVCLIKVQPHKADYWDSLANCCTSFI